MKSKWNESEWYIKHNGKIILLSNKNQPMIYVGQGNEKIEMYRGNFDIQDYITSRVGLQVTKAEETNNGWKLNFEERIIVNVNIEGEIISMTIEQLDLSINRFWIRVQADKGEKCYGCGEQLSYFNLRGKNFPIWTSEPGVGRDKTTYVTWQSDICNKAGGDYYNTNYPQPTYVSTKNYYLHSDCTAYADFDFRNDTFHELQFFAVPKLIRIEYANDMQILLYKLSEYFGRQPLLPDWIYDGVIIGVQGGTKRAFNLADRSIRNGIKLAGIWCQDWSGKLETSFGRRLNWDWHWNESMYPNLPEKIKEYKEKGIRFLAYNNCYLVKDSFLYNEAYNKGYFACSEDGSDYLVDFGEFDCGVIDLTNINAYNWYKECIKKYILDFGIDGWMADFGEYLPIDIKLHSGMSAMLAHNYWPALWAKCNYDAVVESGKLGEAVYFMRAGAAGTQKHCTLLWSGDQSVDFSTHDGLPTVIVSALSAGMMGCGLTHSDIGGYTSLFDNTRTKELFLRWAEMAVFTPVMRTHEGNRPDTNFQYYDDADTMERFARLVNIHVALKSYLKDVVEQNSTKGLPVQRPLFLHYPKDEKTYDIQTEYLLGEDILCAPVLKADIESWNVYLPDDEWVHMWSGDLFTGGLKEVKADIGFPSVFYRKKSLYANVFETFKFIK